MDELAAVPAGESTPPITATSQVKLYPYLCRHEGDDYIVGRPELSVFMSIPPLGVDAMRLLNQGLPIEEVSRRLQEDETPPDIVDFVQTLLDYGLVAEIDGQPIGVTVEEEEQHQGVQVFRRLRGEHVGWLFSSPALLVYAIMLLVTTLLLVRSPQYLPTSDDFFVLPWYAPTAVVVIATAWALIFVHELGHLFAARTMGVDGRLSLGRRLDRLVAQCHVSNIWQLPRRQRLIVYSAGMIVNLWFFFLALVLLSWAGPALPPLVVHLLKLILVLEWYGTGWQFLFYMKTDVYFIVADLFRARNLMEDAGVYLRQALSRMLPWLPPWSESHDLSHIPPRERRFIQVYAVFYVLGVGIAMALFLGYLLPFAMKMTFGAIAVLFQGPTAGVLRLVDAVVTLVVNGLSYGLLGWFWWRDWRGRLLRVIHWVRTRKQTQTKTA